MKFEEIRKKIGTQKELAELLNIDRTTVCKWEKGISYPRRNVLRKLKELTGLEIGEIYQAIDNSKQI